MNEAMLPEIREYSAQESFVLSRGDNLEDTPPAIRSNVRRVHITSEEHIAPDTIVTFGAMFPHLEVITVPLNLYFRYFCSESDINFFREAYVSLAHTYRILPAYEALPGYDSEGSEIFRNRRERFLAFLSEDEQMSRMFMLMLALDIHQANHTLAYFNVTNPFREEEKIEIRACLFALRAEMTGYIKLTPQQILNSVEDIDFVRSQRASLIKELKVADYESVLETAIRIELHPRKLERGLDAVMDWFSSSEVRERIAAESYVGQTKAHLLTRLVLKYDPEIQDLEAMRQFYRVVDESDKVYLPPPALRPKHWRVWRELRIRYEELQSLSETERSTLIYYYMLDDDAYKLNTHRTLRDIANIMGMTYQAISKARQRALESLRIT